MNRVRDLFEKINIEGKIAFGEPLSNYTTFQVGGPAEVFAQPRSIADVKRLVECAEEHRIPWFILGGGANILVSDAGISGLVIHMESLSEIRRQGTTLFAQAGIPVSKAAAWAADQGLSGFDFIYAMPGSVGGAIWMNARCYGSEIADILTRVTYLDPQGTIRTMVPSREEFRYKDTPFMKNSNVILQGEFNLHREDSRVLWNRMRGYEADRRSKGHFDAPCAGSIFKNNRDFGAPSGKLIDSLGLRGLAYRGAQVSPGHANIIINRGGALASDIRALITQVQQRVQDGLGITLEPEVLFVGDWEHEQSS
ncbi:UDP-N-acetylmuramate dehydrogenase [Spirochaeta lutea]|uniref:UDP-N-acetylenolpyruvoylglucosamine reductase n=1 Tax=Spirochaeta lutea TaxID=1480694 RepID=A0A098QSS9_9SPIO|nr:UDP-N-acetylmuramate dehydrogenase [Spirochaeta lutea]KGE70784.1 hypothetical protein DC28_14920 [Spirochaeta lutea]